METIKDHSDLITLSLNDTSIRVSLRRSNKAKNVIIRLNHLREAELVIPKGGSLEHARKFLIQKQAWLFEKIKKFKYQSNPTSSHIPIFGEARRIHHQNSSNLINVSMGSGVIKVSCHPDSIIDTVTAFLQNIFFEEVTKLAENLAKKHGLAFNKITIKRSITRWGSCSSGKNLSFNWRLVFAPREVIRYVVVHELCHLKEMNHSSKFWKLVEAIEPDFQSAITWLKENQAMLYSVLSY